MAAVFCLAAPFVVGNALHSFRGRRFLLSLPHKVGFSACGAGNRCRHRRKHELRAAKALDAAVEQRNFQRRLGPMLEKSSLSGPIIHAFPSLWKFCFGGMSLFLRKVPPCRVGTQSAPVKVDSSRGRHCRDFRSSPPWGGM